MEVNMKPVTVNKDNFESEVLSSDKPVLVDFWATWCGPCRMLGPVLEEIANEREDIKVCKVNVDEEEDLAMKYNIMSIPALFVFKNGEVANKSVGLLPKDQVLKLI